KENKLKEKESELKELNKNNNSPSNNQPDKSGNSNLLLYVGLAAMGAIIILLA
ncbi:1467_t:CDS:1, partial [Ambispora leptoticha]